MELINKIRNMINNKIKKMGLINEIKNRINNKIKNMGLINEIKNRILTIKVSRNRGFFRPLDGIVRVVTLCSTIIKKRGEKIWTKKRLLNMINNMIKKCDYDNYQGEWKIRGVLWMAQFLEVTS